MRVLFDEQIFLFQKRGGISRYFTELIRTFLKEPGLDVEPVITFNKSSNEILLSLSKELDLGITSISSPKTLQIAQAIRANSLRFPKVDVLHHTFYSKTFWHSGYRGPRTSTHYDMIPETFHHTRFGVNPHLSKRWYFDNVNHIFSISESARKDLQQIWPEIVTPISTTHLGKPEVPNQEFHRIQGYIIFIGVRGGYKDAESLFRAFARLPEQLRGKLEFLGGDKFTESEMDLIDNLGIQNHTSQRNVTDLELAEAYGKAHLFVFPSHYEGFGLPALEALQFGCRSVLANTPALKEVAENCADYFAPGNVDELADALLIALSASPHDNPYLDSGLARAGSFSWLRTARETAKVYQSLV
jgi:glycosyltransferase involved in cell wall biosynthesis